MFDLGFVISMIGYVLTNWLYVVGWDLSVKMFANRPHVYMNRVCVNINPNRCNVIGYNKNRFD